MEKEVEAGKELVNIEVEPPVETSGSMALTTANVEDLNKESLMLINQIINETDDKKATDLTRLFNQNQNKKTMVRMNKLSELLDVITDQAVDRFTQRPDNITTKEMMDGLKTVHDLLERDQKQIMGSDEVPLIQINQQNNEVNVGGEGSGGNLNRDSRERVKNAVLSFLGSLSPQTPQPVNITPSQEEIIVEEDSNE